jgi:BirA family biotin operon repressor/biotin-[acetyl-CoA-carboxylase] ligase
LSRRLPRQQLEAHLPNDVYVDGKKICGILLESPTPQYAILGIGLNVNNRLNEIPPEFADDLASRSITSIFELLGRETDCALLINELLNELDEYKKASLDNFGNRILHDSTGTSKFELRD